MSADNDSGGWFVKIKRGWKVAIQAGVALLGCFSVAAGTFPATVAAQTAKLPPRANGFLTITPLEAKALLER
jgi:hypothetical protein